MKKIIKKIKSSLLFHKIIAFILANYIKFVLATARQQHDIPDATIPYLRGEKNTIYAIWHNRIALIPAIHNRQINLSAIVSRHNDGRIIGGILSHFGISIAYGSTSNGGAQAMRQLIDYYKKGSHIAITPDGPRGPSQVAASGVAQFAILLNAPVICISASTNRMFRLNSWDRFILPLPFSKIYFAYSEPIFADNMDCDVKKYDREAMRLAVQSCLNQLTEKTEKMLNNNML
jgi:lysophospholipid acyltransferase (LPLAT)-like uncharacterized protein